MMQLSTTYPPAMSAQTFAPQVAPRDLQDTLIAVLIGTVQCAVLFGVPGLAAYLATGSFEIAMLVAIVLYLLFASCSVSVITLAPEGIGLRRMLGGPRLIAWKDIKSVHEVTREELLVHGWLWPFLPPREMTPTMTSLGHFRIQYGSRGIYFPPKDAAAFQAAVARHLGQQGA